MPHQRNEPLIPELLTAAAHTPDADRAWVQGHVAMFFHVWCSGTPEAQLGAVARAWCAQMAQAYPQDAREWEQEGETYRER